MAETVRCFEQATKLDPTFADAYAAWADFYVIKAGDFLRMREVMPRARELALRAVELDPNSSEAHSALGNIALQFDNDWPRAEAEFNRALAINPSNARALSFYGLELVMLGRYDEAKELFRRLIRLDPGGLHERQFAWVELTSGHAEAALRQMREEVDRDPTRLEHHIYLGLFYLEAGRLEDAAREAAFSAAGASEEERFDHALLNALVGRPEEARAILAEEERGEAKSYNSGTVLAMLYATIGEKEKALDHLERDAHEGDRVLWLYFRGIFFDSIREDPRFVALLREYGLPTTPPLRLTNPSSGGGR